MPHFLTERKKGFTSRGLKGEDNKKKLNFGPKVKPCFSSHTRTHRGRTYR